MFGIICKDTETPDAGVKLNQVRSEGAAAGTRGSLAPGQTHPALDQPTKSQISRDFAAEINTCSTRSLACIFFWTICCPALLPHASIHQPHTYLHPGLCLVGISKMSLEETSPTCASASPCVRSSRFSDASSFPRAFRAFCQVSTSGLQFSFTNTSL